MKPITSSWAIDVDDTLQSRVEDGSLVFRGPGRTVSIDCMGKRESREETVARLRAEAAPALVDECDGVVHRLVFAGAGGGPFTLHAYAVDDREVLMMAIRYDDASDADWACAVGRSASRRR